MDRDQILEDVPIFLLIGIMFVIRIVPEPYSNYLFWGGFVVTIGFVLGTEYIYRITASKYLNIKATVRPTGETLHMFIKESRDGIHSRCIDRENQIYETPLTLGEPLRNRRFRNVRQVVFEHRFEWEKRMIGLPGKAIFRGYSVDHPRTMSLTLWTPREGQTTIDHLETIPLFVVWEAPRDYYIVSQGEYIGPDSLKTDLAVVKDGDPNVVAQLREELAQVKHKNMELQRYGFTQHRLLIRIEGEFSQLKNEFRGVLSRSRDVSKLVLEELLTVLSAHSEIEEAVNEYRKRPWITITVGLALLILGGFALYEYGYNADFRTGISNNALLIGIVAVCAIFLAMTFMLGRRKGKGRIE